MANELVPAGSKDIVAVQGRPGIAIYRSAETEVYDDVDTGDTGLDVAPGERRLPILRILDPKSPQCNDPADGGIAGARGGTIFNTQTGEIYDGKRGLHVIPAYKDCKYVKYIKRDDDGSGGGFVTVLEPDDPEVKRCQAEAIEQYGDTLRKLPAGENEDGKELELVETYYLYCICVVPNSDGSFAGEFGQFFPALVPFSSTAIKTYNAFLDRAKNMRYNVKTSTGVRPSEVAMWSHVWHLQSQLRKRGSQSWYIWRMSLAAKGADGIELPYQESRLPRNNPLYLGAEELRTSALEGNAKVDYEKDTGEAKPTTEGAEYNGGTGPADIPFGNA